MLNEASGDAPTLRDSPEWLRCNKESLHHLTYLGLRGVMHDILGLRTTKRGIRTRLLGIGESTGRDKHGRETVTPLALLAQQVRPCRRIGEHIGRDRHGRPTNDLHCYLLTCWRIAF